MHIAASRLGRAYANAHRTAGSSVLRNGRLNLQRQVPCVGCPIDRVQMFLGPVKLRHGPRETTFSGDSRPPHLVISFLPFLGDLKARHGKSCVVSTKGERIGLQQDIVSSLSRR